MPVEYTDARNACWNAVLNWPAFEDTFARRYKFDGDTAPEVSPHADQLPALQLYPSSATSNQYTNRQHEETYGLVFLIYTAGWNPAESESIAKQIRKALWQSKPEGQPTYVQSATGSHPLPEIVIGWERGHLHGNAKATLATFEFTLKLKHDPLL